MAVRPNTVGVEILGLEVLTRVIAAAGDDEWLEDVQKEWAEYAARRVEPLTPRKSGNLAGSTEGVTYKKDRRSNAKYPAVVRQKVWYGQFVEMKPQKRHYMLEAQSWLQYHYKGYLQYKSDKYLRELGLK